jgi:hypothetical protein
LRTHWERALGAVLVLLGAVLVVIGYAGIKGARYAVDEISFLISGGVGGVLALMLGTTLFINGDRRTELTALDRLAESLEAEAPEDPISTARRDARPQPTDVTRPQITV